MDGWNVLTLPALTQTALDRLLRNEVAAIRVPLFVEDADRTAACAALLRAPDWAFYDGTSPPLGRLGITQYEHHDAMDDYLSAAPVAAARRSAVLSPSSDVLETVIGAFAAAWPRSVGVAHENGRPYFAGIFRRGGGGGVKIHADWGPRDAPGWSIERITAQLAWNLFYSSPGAGGELVVYDYPWEPGLEAHARQRFNDYDEAVFASTRRIEVAPQPGDLIVFNSRNAHAVRPSSDGGARIAIGSFIGATHDGDLVFWS